MGRALPSLACALMLTSVALGAQTEVARTFTLHGYYALGFHPLWQESDHRPWYLLKQAPWVDQRLINYGYVAVIHDRKHYYCLIQNAPPTGTRIGEPTHICGAPETAEMLYMMNYRPKILIRSSPP
jgi:hypothetical protein